MENEEAQRKYLATIQFEMNEEFMNNVPAHRTYINYLINKGIIDHYVVSLETNRSWITINAGSKPEVFAILEKSPLNKWWNYEVDELFVYDGQAYRLPALTAN